MNKKNAPEYNEDIIYPLLYKSQKKKDYKLQFDVSGRSIFTSVEQIEKVLDNPKKPITIRKAQGKSIYGDATSQEMLAWFPEKNICKIFIGKPGCTIKKIPDDIAVNGELEMQLDREHLNALINGILEHNFAVSVAADREERRTDYLDDVVILPEGKYFDEEGEE